MPASKPFSQPSASARPGSANKLLVRTDQLSVLAGEAKVNFGKGAQEKESDDDTVFYGQIFTGLVYNFGPRFDIFGGIRYIHF